MNHSEKEISLLKGLANQKSEATKEIYRTHYPMIEHMVISNKGDQEDAADIFQETMIVLYKKAVDPSFQLHCQLKTFIYSVARRLWLKKLQNKFSKTFQLDDYENYTIVESEFDSHEKTDASYQMMEAAMAKIGEPCKSILEAYYIKNKNMQEIATAFHYTNADNAKTQKYKCMVRLKKLFFAAYNTRD